MIEYTKRLANSSTWEGTLAYRPFLFPNRPIHLLRSNRIGNITAVTYSWSIGKDAGVSIALNNLMAERIGKDGNSSFRLLTGAVNTPISYATLWGNKGDKETGVDAAEPTSGVHSPATNNVSKKSGASPTEPEKPLSSQQVRERVTNPPAEKWVRQAVSTVPQKDRGAFSRVQTAGSLTFQCERPFAPQRGSKRFSTVRRVQEPTQKPSRVGTSTVSP
jgi:hypothetical protein